MSKKPKQKRSVILKIVLLAFCVYMVASLSNEWSKLNKLEKERDDLILQYENDQKTIEELKIMLKDESNKKIIEKAARERLGYIYSDEQVFIDISGN